MSSLILILLLVGSLATAVVLIDLVRSERQKRRLANAGRGEAAGAYLTAVQERRRDRARSDVFAGLGS
mgnify:CR=1 FL=1